MDFNPQTFFIGVIDFFSVLLPGALLTYFFSGIFYNSIFGYTRIFPSPTNESAPWVIFLFISYMLGNIVFMLASFIDPSYNKFLRKKYFERNFDLNYKTARKIQWNYINPDKEISELHEINQFSKENYLQVLSNSRREILNTYKWSQHFLLYNKPEALSDIKRSEADSKFFRSLIVAFLIMAIALIIQKKYLESSICAILVLLCYYRYGELRFKTNEKAYELIITYNNLNHRENQSNRPTAITSSVLKSEIDQEFELKHREKIKYLIKGFINDPKQVVIKSGELNETIFQSKQIEYWYCLQGKGALIVKDEDGEHKHILQSNTTIPISGGTRYLFQNKSQEPLELIVISQ